MITIVISGSVHRLDVSAVCRGHLQGKKMRKIDENIAWPDRALTGDREGCHVHWSQVDELEPHHRQNSFLMHRMSTDPDV